MLEPQPVQSAWPIGLIGILMAGILPGSDSLFCVRMSEAMTSPTIEMAADVRPGKRSCQGERNSDSHETEIGKKT